VNCYVAFDGTLEIRAPPRSARRQGKADRVVVEARASKKYSPYLEAWELLGAAVSEPSTETDGDCQLLSPVPI